MHDLPPAASVDVKNVRYYLRSVKTPVLTGWLLRLFFLISRSPVWTFIHTVLSRKSGFPQVLKELSLPDKPTFQASAAAGNAPRDFRFCQDLSTNPVQAGDGASAAERLELAASVLPPRVGGPQSSSLPTIRDYHAAYSEGRVTPVQVAHAILEFIKHNDPGDLHWFLFHGARTLADAERSAERWRANAPLSLLDGVPFAVKDNIDVAEYPTCAGTRYLHETRPTKGDYLAVAALRAAGAIVIGKTVMHELGLSTLGVNSHHGTPRNPWSPGHVCGGSSSGSAAVVGSGLVPFSLAADGGGSVRVPAGFCGCVGLMPTNARSNEEGSILSATTAVKGCITTCVEDALLLYAVLADSPEAPPITLPRLRPRSAPANLAGVRVGVYREWFEDCDRDVLSACRGALAAMERAGAEIVDVVVPELELLRVAHMVTIGSELYNGFKWAFEDPTTRAKMGLDIAVALGVLKLYTASDYIQAQRIRTRMTQHVQRVFEQVHVVVTPTTPSTAPRLLPSFAACGVSDLSTTARLMRFMQMANLLGLPAVALPCGLDAGGLPISFHIMAAPFCEASLLVVADEFVKLGCMPTDARPKIVCKPLSCLPKS